MAMPSPDKDELVQCPYNSSHFIGKFRLNSHLVVCGKNYPDSWLVTCKYNANHMVPAPERQQHDAMCPDRYKFELPLSEEEKIVADRYPIPNIDVDAEESWDNDNVPTYNPKEYCMAHNVVQKLDVASASVKKQFRWKERQRMNDLEYKQHMSVIANNCGRENLKSSKMNGTLVENNHSSYSTSRDAREMQPSTKPAEKKQLFTSPCKFVQATQLFTNARNSAKENQLPTSTSIPNWNSENSTVSSDVSSPEFILVGKKGKKRKSETSLKA